jgi:hypothetical protein
VGGERSGRDGSPRSRNSSRILATADEFSER